MYIIHINTYIIILLYYYIIISYIIYFILYILCVYNKIKRDIQFLNNSEKMKSILENTKLIVSRRQPKNMKKQLTQARFISEKFPNTVTKCGEKPLRDFWTTVF